MDTKTQFFTFAPTIESDPTGIPTGFSGVAYSGGIVPDYGWLGNVVIDLASVTIPDRMFALINHDEDQRAGHCRVWLDANSIRVSGTFSKITDAGKGTAAEFAEGAPWKLSIGFNARLDSYSPSIDTQINGQTMKVDGVFRNARVLEVSFVPADADPNTNVTAFASNPIQQKDITMSDLLNQQISELTAKLAELSVKLAAETTRADTAETRLKEQHQAVRLHAVKALFEATGREYDDAKAQPYLGMDEATFSAVADDLKASRASSIDPSLFSATAIKGKPAQETVTLSATDIYALRNKQVAQLRGVA